jgi:hypothetical protein
MAIVDITEYQNVAFDGLGARVAAGIEPARRVMQLAVGASPATSDPILDTTKFVRIHTDSTIRIQFASPAGPTSQRMPANSTEYFGVTPGITVSVIASA